MIPSRCVTGLTTLGASGYPGGDNGIRAIVDITYYNHCSGIFIDNISEVGVNVPNDYYYANQDFYANDSFGWWSFSGCPSLNDAYSIALNINRTEPYGDYYVAGWLNVGIVSQWCDTWAGGNWYENQSSFLLN